MNLRYHLPRSDLRDFIRSYYLFSTDGPAVQPLPAELGNIRLVLAGGGRLSPPGGAEMAVPHSFLMGPTTGAYRIEMEAGTRVFGVGVLPRGWAALLGVSAEEAADQVVDLAAFMGPASTGAMQAIEAARSLPAMAAIADDYFAGLLKRRTHGAFADYPTALEKWLLRPDDPGLDDLLSVMDLSRRQTDRLAKRFFGASPKLLQRKQRILRAADRFRNGATDWRDAAGEAFYDQSHFIKEFKAFIGVTPLEFARNQAPIAAAIGEQRGRVVADHPLAGL